MTDGRDSRLVVRVTAREKRELEALARKERLTLADWIRERLGLKLAVGEVK